MKQVFGRNLLKIVTKNKCIATLVFFNHFITY